MPLREFGCKACGLIVEVYSPLVNPEKVPVPACSNCKTLYMEMLWSTPHLDTSSTFHAFDYKDIDTGRTIRIDNLHMLRAVEHASLATGRNIRFDAYSAEPSNPDAIDGAGLEYWDGNPGSTSGKAYNIPPARKLATMK